jgi:hypothetical protein
VRAWRPSRSQSRATQPSPGASNHYATLAPGNVRRAPPTYRRAVVRRAVVRRPSSVVPSGAQQRRPDTTSEPETSKPTGERCADRVNPLNSGGRSFIRRSVRIDQHRSILVLDKVELAEVELPEVELAEVELERLAQATDSGRDFFVQRQSLATVASSPADHETRISTHSLDHRSSTIGEAQIKALAARQTGVGRRRRDFARPITVLGPPDRTPCSDRAEDGGRCLGLFAFNY